MKQNEVTDYEQDISKDKASNLRGKARVMIAALKHTPESMRDLDNTNVERLKDIFTMEGCRRDAPERHVPVVISMDDVTRAIALTGSTEVSLDKLLDNPKELPPLLKFPPGVHIQCLTGKHRIQAAKECTTLPASERWWIVDLYLEGRIFSLPFVKQQ